MRQKPEVHGVTMSVAMNVSLHQELDDAAYSDRVSRSALVREFIRQGLKAREEALGKTGEAA